jgi:hypothetical protein
MASFSVITSFVGLIFFLCSCFLPAAPVAGLFFNYSSFSSDDSKDFNIEGQAYINRGWIEVSAFASSGIGNSRGRASYAHPMPLWDGATGEVASFTTRFDFVIDPPPPLGINNKGTGMAFFLAAYPSILPPDSAAYDMSLTNQKPEAVATGNARFVAVEFDTFNDTAALDPNSTYDHVGIDVNSIRSVATMSLESFTLRGNLTAEIRYDNISSILEMTLWLGDLSSTQRSGSYHLSQKVDLKSALPENVSVGFSASTSTSIELHQLHSWYFNSSLEPKAAALIPAPPPPPTPSTPDDSERGGVIAGATVGAALFLVLLFATAALLARWRRSKRRELAEELGEIGGLDDDDDDGAEPIMEIEMGTGPRRFPYRDLVAATKSFAPEEKLGQGGFGSVYRGHLREHGAVAIKRFAKGSSNQGRKEYKSEIKVISRLRHRNLVQLVGWCHGRDELLLVYELVPNRSLDVHLHGDGGNFLTWPMRYS